MLHIIADHVAEAEFPQTQGPGRCRLVALAIKSTPQAPCGGSSDQPVVTTDPDPLPFANRLTVCQTRELSVTNGDRLHLKANRKLASGGRVTNGELVFAAHEVPIRGHHLRRIETGMERKELSLVTVLPGNQRNYIPEGQPVIREITVKDAADI